MDDAERSESPRAPRRRAWRRWAVWGAVIIAIYALLGFFVVPPVARHLVEKLSREKLSRRATIQQVRFNPFTLTGRVEGFELVDRDGAPLLKLDGLVLNLQVSGVFRRAWRFREVSLDGLHAVARILADGTPSLGDLFKSEAPVPPEEAARPLPRLIVDRLVLKGGEVQFVDESMTPRFVETLAPLDIQVDDLTTIPDESGDHTLTLGIGKEARVNWSGRQTIEPFRLEGKIEITDASLPRAGNYALTAQPLEVHEGKLDMVCPYTITRDANAGIQVSLTGMTLTARDVAVRPRGGDQDWLVVPRAEVRDARVVWPESRIEVGEVRITEPHVVAWLAEDGKLNWQAMLPAEKAAANGAVAPASVERRWAAKVALVEISRGSASIEDRSVSPSVVMEPSAVGIRLEGLTSDLSAPVGARLTARLGGSAEFGAVGTVVLEPAGASLDVTLRGLDLVPLESYLARLPGATLRGGVAGVKGKLTLSSGSPSATFDGQATVDGLEMAGAGVDRLVAWERAEARQSRLTVGPDRLRIGSVVIDRAFLRLRIDREGNVNLEQLLAPAPASGTAPPPATRGTRATFPVEISTLTLRDASADFTDESLILPFRTEIHSAKGIVRDLSTTSAVPARLEIEGRMAETGFVKADGTIRIAEPFASSDVGVIFRGVNMPDLSPYTAQFAGYAVESGTLDLDIRYRLQDRRLVGDHRLVADNMVLGDKVEGGEVPGLPVRLAIALLKDKNGRIDLQVPIEGTVDSPEFAYSKVFWQAVKKILANVAAAPFRAIGRLFGADQEELELVGFVSGRSDLPAPEQEKLSKIASELAARPELSLEVEGRFDPVTDIEAMRHDRLERRIDEKRAGETSPEKILEAIYVETFSAERLEVERAKFQPAAPPATLDAAAFYDSLRAQLLAAEVVGEPDLVELARARSAAILVVLTAPGGIDPARAQAAEPGPVKRKKQGSEMVPSEMILSAKD